MEPRNRRHPGLADLSERARQCAPHQRNAIPPLGGSTTHHGASHILYNPARNDEGTTETRQKKLRGHPAFEKTHHQAPHHS